MGGDITGIELLGTGTLGTGSSGTGTLLTQDAIGDTHLPTLLAVTFTDTNARLFAMRRDDTSGVILCAAIEEGEVGIPALHLFFWNEGPLTITEVGGGVCLASTLTALAEWE